MTHVSSDESRHGLLIGPYVPEPAAPLFDHQDQLGQSPACAKGTKKSCTASGTSIGFGYQVGTTCYNIEVIQKQVTTNTQATYCNRHLPLLNYCSTIAYLLLHLFFTYSRCQMTKTHISLHEQNKIIFPVTSEVHTVHNIFTAYVQVSQHHSSQYQHMN